MERLKKRRILLGALVIAAFALMPLTLGFAKEDEQPVVIIDDGTVAQGVKIVSLDVSGLDTAGVLAKLQSAEGQTMLDSAKLILTLPYGTIDVALPDIKASPVITDAIANAMKIGRSGGISQRSTELEAAKNGSTVINIPYTYDADALTSKLTAISDSIPRDTVAGSLKFDSTNFDNPFTIVDGHLGFTPDTATLIANAKTALASGAINGITVPGTSAPDTNGVNVLTKGTAANTVLLARFNLNPISNSGGRFHNITSGCNLINGKILQPGDTFSVNDTLGPRDGSHNGLWAAAPVNEDGRHEMDYGGGLCRVSTTLFNAAVRANLEIVEWVHHSIPSDYIKIGCDATVSTGGPDLKFKNNTDWPIYVMMKFDTKTRVISAEIWGSPQNLEQAAAGQGLADGTVWGLGTKKTPTDQTVSGSLFTVEIDGKVTGSKAMPATQYTNDPTKVRKGRAGKYSDTYRIWYKWTIGTDGKGKWVEYYRETIESHHLYPAWAPIVMESEKPTPTPTPNPSI